MSTPLQPNEPQNPHPVAVKQEAERAMSINTRWHAGRLFAFGVMIIGIVLAFTGSTSVGGLLLLWSGLSLGFAALDLHTYNKATKRFTQKYSVSPKEWLEQHARA